MPQRTKTVAEKMAELYALLATAAAKRAISSLEHIASGNATREADFWATQTGKWLDASSAAAVRWTYRTPRLPS